MNERLWREKLFLFFPHITTDLFFDPRSPVYISPNDHVLVVGPGIESHSDFSERAPGKLLPMDRSLIVLPPYLATGTGRITVFDLPGTQKDIFSGSHDLMEVRRFVESLLRFAQICPVSYIEGDLTDLNVRNAFDENFDTIIDHLTTYTWIMDTRLTNLQERTLHVAQVYYDVLKSGGKALIFYEFPKGMSKREDPVWPTATEAFKQAGFGLIDTHVNDLYTIPTQLQTEFSSESGYKPYLLDDKKNLRPTYQANGLLIAKKP